MTDLENLVNLFRAVAKEVTRNQHGDLQSLPPDEQLTDIVQDALTHSGKQLTLQDATPPFGGQREDGNPITFLLRHYRSKIEAGHFYQCDLELLDDKLATSLKNLFKSRRWHAQVMGAADDLRALDLPTQILGRELSSAETLSHILPGRKNIRQKHASRSARTASPHAPAIRLSAHP